jgi:DNA-binding NarL/FixJ family response regulator
MLEQVRVLLVDDHPVVRKGLRATIEDDPMLVVIGEASNGEAAIRLALEMNLHVAVIDIEMPGMNRISIARQIRSRNPETSVIFMTFYADEDLVRAAMEAGGAGYLLKGSETEEVTLAIHAAVAGRTYIGSTLANILVGSKNEAAISLEGVTLKSLTTTEKKILRLLANGKSSKEIGDELAVHFRTVENHRSNICRKLDLEGANALTRFALQHRAALHERLH